MTHPAKVREELPVIPVKNVLSSGKQPMLPPELSSSHSSRSDVSSIAQLAMTY